VGTRDRRSSDRFPIEREVKFRTSTEHGLDETGSGKTLNMSSGGILFALSAEQEIAPGRDVEISVSWPAQLGDGCCLKFVAKGQVVRADSTTAAVRIQNYEFRTTSRLRTDTSGS
jgi:PilZ domain